MRDSKKNQKFWQEWDAFCGPLIAGVKVYDRRSSFQALGNTALCPQWDVSKELDLYLRLSFDPLASYDKPELFADTPPALEQALLERIANAKALLTKILERVENQNIHSGAEFLKATGLSFQELLLPSPPSPDDYTFR
jgi:hypothetical protein